VRISPRWQSTGGKGGGQAARGLFSPDLVPSCQVSIAHGSMHPHSHVAWQKPQKVPCHSKSRHAVGHYAYIAYAARATQWQHHGNTMALKNGSQEYILPAIMHQMVGFSKDLPLHHLHPTHHWPHEHMRLPLCAMGHGMGCTCLFSMIQSAAGSKLHPLPNWQLCQATVMDQVRQSAADRQTSRSAPPHSHHLTHHCTSCTQGIPYATVGIGPEPRAQLLQLEPAQSTQHPTFSASSRAACCMPLHAWCLLPPCLAMLAGHNQTCHCHHWLCHDAQQQ